MSFGDLSRSLTTEEKDHFEEFLKYTFEKLAIYEPFYIYSLYQIKITAEVSKLPALGSTNGRDIKMYYPLALKLKPSQFAGVIHHELMHILNLHIPRLKGKHRFLWNIATDISINEVIFTQQEKNGYRIELTPGTIRSPTVAHLPCEEIYDRLINNELPNMQIIRADGGEVESVEYQDPTTGKRIVLVDDGNSDLDYDGAGDPGEIENNGERLLRESRTAFGSVGNGIERIVIDALDKAKVDWKVELRKYITRHAADYSFVTKDRRFQSYPFFVPGVESSSKGSVKVAVGIDLSGSIRDEDISSILTECLAIERQFDFVEFVFVPFDVDTYGKFTARSKADILKAFRSFRGGGGTSFIQVLKELDTKGTVVILMFTDLMGHFPSQPPKPDVLWIDISTYNVQPPFGRVIKYGRNT